MATLNELVRFRQDLLDTIDFLLLTDDIPAKIDRLTKLRADYCNLKYVVLLDVALSDLGVLYTGTDSILADVFTETLEFNNQVTNITNTLIAFNNELSKSVVELKQAKTMAERLVVMDQIEKLPKIKTTAYPWLPIRIFKKNCEFLLNDVHQQIIAGLQKIIPQLDNDRRVLAATMFTNKVYESKFVEINITQSLPLDFEIENLVGSRISGYSSWRYPCLQINPRNKKWIDFMIAGDPLYLASIDTELTQRIISNYPTLYQSRVRVYQYKDAKFINDLLPTNQFGFVLCWDFFNYLYHGYVENYLRVIYELLRPGGVVMFSYNNCDIEISSNRAEQGAESYLNIQWLHEVIGAIGYEIVANTNIKASSTNDVYVSWLELRKPGELKSVKAHQALGQIIEK